MAVARLAIDPEAVPVAKQGQVIKSAVVSQRHLEQLLDRVFAPKQGHSIADVVNGVVRQQCGDLPAERLFGWDAKKVAGIARDCVD